MAIRDIRLFGDPVLNTAAEEVDVFDERLHRLVGDMLETMDAAGGVGLAANQVGVAQRVFVFDCQGLRGHIVNPVWTPLGEDTQIGVEGCLSVPDVRGTVERHNTVVAHGADMCGRPLTLRGSGLLARCIQNEADHLDGVMFTARMPPADRKAALDAIAAAERNKEN